MNTQVYDFLSARKAMLERQGRWTLEDDIKADMLACGYNPSSRKDIQEYWQEIFSEEMETT